MRALIAALGLAVFLAFPAVAQAPGPSLAEVLSFKFPGAPGIMTMGKADGSVVISEWPTALGARPTTGDIARWTAEFRARPIPNPEMTAEDLWEVLRGKGTVTDADVPGDRRQPPRRP